MRDPGLAQAFQFLSQRSNYFSASHLRRFSYGVEEAFSDGLFDPFQYRGWPPG